ncbi:kinase-like protein [Lenzites betulinus]|nr:kinase-like protein [Lenzites betulinus]
MDGKTVSIPLVGRGSEQRKALAVARGQELLREQADIAARNEQLLNLPELAHIARHAYKPSVTDILMGRYRVERTLGYGSFGSVVRAEDVLTGQHVAVKVLHRVRGLHRDVHNEARMYETLVEGCSPRISLFAEVLGVGTHCGFPCTVFELCQATLFDIIKIDSQFLPLPSRHVCEIGYQIILGVEYLHSLGILHGDIKPDNIALKHFDSSVVQALDSSGQFRERRILTSTALCIIDLGSSVQLAHVPSATGIIGANMYRAPEVDLRMPYSLAIDTFAIGCVVAEVYLGKALFDPGIVSDLEHLAIADRISGPFPLDFAQAIERARAGTFRFKPKIEVIFPPKNCKYPRSALVEAVHRFQGTKHICAVVHDAVFVDLLKRLLLPDPSRRVALSAALRHSYFDQLSLQSRTGV